MGLQAVCRDCQVPMEIQAVWIPPGLPIVFIRKKKQQIHLVKWHPLLMQKNIKFTKIFGRNFNITVNNFYKCIN